LEYKIPTNQKWLSLEKQNQIKKNKITKKSLGHTITFPKQTEDYITPSLPSSCILPPIS